MKNHDIAADLQGNSEIELSRIFYLTSLKGIKKASIDIIASEKERKLLSIRCSLLSLEYLRAQITVDQISSKKIIVKGDIRAKTRQECVVTLEPFNINIKSSFSQSYLIDNTDLDNNSAVEAENYDLSEILIGDTIDVGELVTQYLSLAIKPYPRSKEADIHMDNYHSNTENDGCFAILKTLIKSEEV